MTPSAPYVLTAADMDAVTSYYVPISNDPGAPVLKLRRMDWLTLLLENHMPEALLRSAEALFATALNRAAGAKGITELFAGSEKELALEFLRHFACAAALQPRFVMDAAEASDQAYPVAGLSADVLFRLYNYAKPPVTIPGVAAPAIVGVVATSPDAPLEQANGEAISAAPKAPELSSGLDA